MLLIDSVRDPLVGRSQQQLGSPQRQGETTTGVVGGVLRPRAERGVPVAVGGASGGGGGDGGGGVRAVRGVRGVPVLLDLQHEQLRGHELLLHHRLADCKPFGTCAFTPQTCGCGGTTNCTQPS